MYIYIYTVYIYKNIILFNNKNNIHYFWLIGDYHHPTITAIPFLTKQLLAPRPSVEPWPRLGFPISLYLDARERRYVEEFNTSNFVAITKDWIAEIPAISKSRRLEDGKKNKTAIWIWNNREHDQESVDLGEPFQTIPCINQSRRAPPILVRSVAIARFNIDMVGYAFESFSTRRPWWKEFLKIKVEPIPEILMIVTWHISWLFEFSGRCLGYPLVI